MENKNLNKEMDKVNQIMLDIWRKGFEQGLKEGMDYKKEQEE